MQRDNLSLSRCKMLFSIKEHPWIVPAIMTPRQTARPHAVPLRAQMSQLLRWRAESAAEIQAGHPLDAVAVILLQAINCHLKDSEPALCAVAVERLDVRVERQAPCPS